MTKPMIVYEDVKMDCPIQDCLGKLEYIAYTAFNCKTCHNGFSIKIRVIRSGRAILTTDGCEEE